MDVFLVLVMALACGGDGVGDGGDSGGVGGD